MFPVKPFVLGAVLALAACVPAGAPQPLAPSPSHETWAHVDSDVEPDPSVRFGTLPNGMRYALMRNATPPGQASLRLRIDAGSLMEADDQRGLAHFMEHMAFNGTARVPEGELLPILERLGLAFGPDTNAFTSFDQTVYQLDLPRTDHETVDTALMILRDMVGDATLDADAIDRERGIVLSEERSRDSPAYRVALERYEFLMRDQLPPERFPIGDVEVLQTAPRERFTALYDAYYRPERATLVAVGDFDVDTLETKIREEFSDWTNPASDGAEPDLGPVQPRGPEARIMVEPGVQPSLTLAWVAPPTLQPDTAAERRRNFIQYLGFAVLNRRLERLSRAEDPPFVAAGAYRTTTLRAQDVFQISASLQPGRWREALTAMETERRRILEFGVTQAELDREIAEQTAAYQTYVAGAGTRRTPTLADAIVDSVHEDEVFSAPAAEYARFQVFAAEATPALVNAALSEAMQGDGPLVFLAAMTPVDGGETGVMAALAEAQGETLEAVAGHAAADWPYQDFGPAGEVVERSVIEDLGVTLVRFANGVRLTIKPTDFREDQVLVRASIGTGRSGLPDDRVTPIWAASSALIEGGLNRINREDLEAVLASRVVHSGFGLEDDAFVLSGGARPDDLEVQLQLLAAYASDPAFAPQAFERIRTVYANALGQLDATPGGVFSREAAHALRGGDLRWNFPDAEQIASAEVEGLRDLLAPVLANAPVELIIVGDVDPDAAIAAAAATFGALPPRSAQGDTDTSIRFPAGADTVRLTHGGRADQGLGFVAWSTTDARADVFQARTLSLLSAVMRLRLVEELREGQAVTYSPSASSSTSWTFPGYGYLSASIEAPPDRLDGFFADVDRIAAQLRETPIDADELERARRPVVEALQRARNTNEYWLGQLSDLQSDETRLPAIRSALADLERITPADLQAAAQAYLRPERAWRAVVTPRGDPE
ncbi:M16 family metallopeptidase [Brevundimonas sp.]|uniref:M16 family metallopeptidase n=1 Tax=Brevundimonas sp. TaxID=1871086 RepID=UPI0025E4A0F1|nr:M16 family metallopeptidase [Brevundimonas sp.]